MTPSSLPVRTVLVVDDVAGIRRLIEATLADDNTTIIHAMGGQSAVELALLHVPDLILLDLAMPGMDGAETVRALRSAPETRHIPVVIVTALAHSDLAQQALTLGANDLIEKPFRPAELRLVVDRWTTGAAA